MTEKYELKNYTEQYQRAVWELWNSAGVRQGFAEMDEPAFSGLLLEHPYFSAHHAFLLMDGETVQGFVCGCTGADLPKGDERGYFTCLLVSGEVSGEKARLLLAALEESFRQTGKIYSACTFFNPMRLPWVIPETNGHRHNNAPGIAVDLPLYDWMKGMGYQETARECAMYLDLNGFRQPAGLEEKRQKAAAAGYQVEWYHPDRHQGLKTMVDALGNPQWSAEIPRAAAEINMLVVSKERQAVGFAGPVYPESTGRGYFAGIAIAKEHENKGLGSLLFAALCQAEKEAGAAYMSLFTGSDNPAGRIYQRAGFITVRTFAVMTKRLSETDP